MKYVLKTNLLAPDTVKTLKFSGLNPSKVLKIIPGIMQETMRVMPASFFEDQIKWDASGDTAYFYAAWRAKDGLDARSTLWIAITLQGSESKKDKTGEVTIWLMGNINTEFPYTNLLHKGAVHLYMTYFYADQRRKYHTEGVRILDMIENEIRRELEIMERA